MHSSVNGSSNAIFLYKFVSSRIALMNDKYLSQTVFISDAVIEKSIDFRYQLMTSFRLQNYQEGISKYSYIIAREFWLS